MVIMCSSRSLLILSSIAASVVDFPDPVGPVTRISPRGLSHMFLTIGGSPSESNPLISQGIVRNTAATAPGWLKTLPRKRARFFRPKEKSSSRFSSKRCFCASVSTLYASDLVSAALNGGISSGRRWPCTRTRGALLVVMCRSLPPISIIFFNNSLSVIPDIFAPSLVQNSQAQTLKIARLQNRFAQYLFHGGHSQRHLHQSASPQGQHSQFHCFLFQLQRGRANQDQFAQLVGNFHHFVQAGSSLVTTLVANVAAFAVINLGGLDLFHAVPGIQQHLRRHCQFFLAVRSNAPHQSLCANQVHRGGHQKRLDTHVHQAADR